MTVNKFLAAVAMVSSGLFVWKSQQQPRWDGAFPVRRAVISKDTAGGIVRDTATNGKLLFTLALGDDCLFLSGDDWERVDKKDAASTTVPVFCRNKGSGWTDLSLLVCNEFVSSAPLKGW
ncbi:hypothetical protein AT302_13245 [Pandoraea norimbergensis]|uniref:Uncharacterized protein n=1 Tax=Pandoraea norimbergensis TaxID=93219 RepID=A0ABN4JI51_9BURK|nr:hypothetical protein AT302_13245 [Pandoraea norimbergensis]